MTTSSHRSRWPCMRKPSVSIVFPFSPPNKVLPKSFPFITFHPFPDNSVSFTYNRKTSAWDSAFSFTSSVPKNSKISLYAADTFCFLKSIRQSAHSCMESRPFSASISRIPAFSSGFIHSGKFSNAVKSSTLIKSVSLREVSNAA